MIKTYTNPEYPYRRSPDQHASTPVHHPVIIVGAGPAGLAAALDFAMQGIATVVLDDNNTVSIGSRAICFAKRTLEIADRYGCGERMVNKGITWNLGKVFFKDRPIYEFNLLPEQHHKLPAFINLQQYYFEEYMVDRSADLEAIDLRWRHKVTAVRSSDDGARISVTTEDGAYPLSCDYLLVADGANSPIRTQLGLESKGQVFADRFLIADVVMKADFPTERWFWFDPPFHPNQSTLLHKQADNVWRIDFQLGWDADPDTEKKAENVIPRVQAMLGADVEFELEWASVYTFQCRKMDSFVHRRVVFIGDAAHQVSPFGARGANGALQGVDNVAWKIAHILRNEAPLALLKTYDDERLMGANENILHSTRATDFITPKNHISRVFRDSTLELAEHYPFARALVNSGRLSIPCVYEGSALNTSDTDRFPPVMQPGSVCADAPVRSHGNDGWLLNHLGNDFACMVNANMTGQALKTLKTEIAQLQELKPRCRLLLIDAAQSFAASIGSRDQILEDPLHIIQQRYDLQAGNVYLIRPDQHVCGRWRTLNGRAIARALKRALGFELEDAA